MKKWIKYISAFAITGILTIALINGAYAQHRGGHGGGGFHGGGGHGGGGFHGGSSFHSGGSRGGNAFHGNAGARAGAFRGGSFHGAVRGGTAFRGPVRGGVGVRGGFANRGGYRGGHYYGGYRGGFYRGGHHYGYGYGGFYRPGFRFGLGWGYPHIGLYFGVLPFGYYPFYYNSLQYYYSGGSFYRPYNGGYQVALPPVGAIVPTLPSNAQAIMIDGQQYFAYDGVYYQESVDNNGRQAYVVAGKDGVLNTGNGGGNVNDQQPVSDNDDPIMDNNAAPNDNQNGNNTASAPELKIHVGDVVDQLPPDCRKITLNNKKLYVSPDNVFYEEYKDANGTGYRVASVPGADEN